MALAWLLTRPFVTSVIIGANARTAGRQSRGGDVALAPNVSRSSTRRAGCRQVSGVDGPNGRTEPAAGEQPLTSPFS
jgi:hypothetical protein